MRQGWLTEDPHGGLLGADYESPSILDELFPQPKAQQGPMTTMGALGRVGSLLSPWNWGYSIAKGLYRGATDLPKQIERGQEPSTGDVLSFATNAMGGGLPMAVKGVALGSGAIMKNSKDFAKLPRGQQISEMLNYAKSDWKGLEADLDSKMDALNYHESQNASGSLVDNMLSKDEKAARKAAGEAIDILHGKENYDANAKLELPQYNNPQSTLPIFSAPHPQSPLPHGQADASSFNWSQSPATLKPWSKMPDMPEEGFIQSYPLASGMHAVVRNGKVMGEVADHKQASAYIDELAEQHGPKKKYMDDDDMGGDDYGEYGSEIDLDAIFEHARSGARFGDADLAAYHGTSAGDFDKFRVSAHASEPGVFMTPDEHTASEYGRKVIPLKVDASKFPVVDLADIAGQGWPYSSDIVQHAIAGAHRGGFPGVIIRNMEDVGGAHDQVIAITPQGLVRHRDTGSVMYAGGLPIPQGWLGSEDE